RRRLPPPLARRDAERRRPGGRRGRLAVARRRSRPGAPGHPCAPRGVPRDAAHAPRRRIDGPRDRGVHRAHPGLRAREPLPRHEAPAREAGRGGEAMSDPRRDDYLWDRSGEPDPEGAWLETDARSRAKVRVADIGWVDVEPRTRVRLVRASAAEHRLELSRGVLHAAVTAVPRLFVVDTPSAVAVDLGCAYTLEVDE